jgi:hypothetical protein
MTTVTVDRVRVDDGISGEQFSKKDQLQIEIQLENPSLTDKADYAGLTPNIIGVTDHPPTLADDLGNTYKPVWFSGGQVVGSLPNGQSIYPNTTITDLLVFEPPIDAASKLRLTIPKSAFGVDGEISFEFPNPSNAEAIRKVFAKFHTLTDESGNFSIDAEIVSASATTVKLRKRDGSEISVPLHKLSDASRRLVKATTKAAESEKRESKSAGSRQRRRGRIP